jgi:peptide-methionine (R)-S-oxide reductase
VSRLAFPSKGLRAVLIQGAHGGFGDESGSSRGLSSPTDLEWLRATRAVSDAVIVSYRTAVREKYSRISLRSEYLAERKRLNLAENPKLVVLTQTEEHAAHAQTFADVVFNTREISLENVIVWLNEQGLVRLSCEGGPQLIEALIEAQLVDQLALTTSTLDAHSPERFPGIEQLQELPQVFCIEDAGFVFALHGKLPTWDDRLHGLAFNVLRNHDTERPFSVDYEKSPAAGYYVCRGCGNRLFDADTQFDARCGWPAFWRPSRDDGVRLLEDRSMFMKRIEVRCKACDGHLGHVFEGEGFGFPTDQRYCINAVALERRY